MLKLSIIVPVYNAELYLERMINSVLYQSYDNWELIFVDDASKDKSCQIIESYANSDARIRLIKNQTNGGPAKARNIGIDKATGDYLGFIDSDDYVAPDYVEIMMNTAIGNNADIVWCSIKEVDDPSHIQHNDRCDIKVADVFNKIDSLRLFYYDTPGLGSMCNKIYRKSIIDKYHLRLNEKRTRAEDWEFNIRVFEQIEKLVRIDNVLYFYIRANTNSVMASFREKDFDLMCESSVFLLDVNKRYNLEIPSGFDNNKNAHSFIEYLINASRSGGDRKFEIISHTLNSRKFKKVMKNCNMRYLPATFRFIRLASFTNNARLVSGLCKLLCD